MRSSLLNCILVGSVVALTGIAPAAVGIANEAAFQELGELVYRRNGWTAICSTDAMSGHRQCDISYFGDTEAGMLRLFGSGTSSFIFLSDQFRSGFFRFHIGDGATIDASCQDQCTFIGDDARSLHAGLLDGTVMVVESPGLPSLYKPITISIADYRAAFAAVVEWYEFQCIDAR